MKKFPFYNYIQLLLENLVPGKAPGPDGLPTYIFKYCASEIAPILQVLYTQSLSTDTVPGVGPSSLCWHN